MVKAHANTPWTLSAEEQRTFHVQPFQVLTMELMP
jgi:hypothetical protein